MLRQAPQPLPSAGRGESVQIAVSLFSSSRIRPIRDPHQVCLLVDFLGHNRKLSAARSSVPGLNRTSSTVRLSVPSRFPSNFPFT